MTDASDILVEDRILQLLQHLKVGQAHFAAGGLGDLAGLAISYPESISSLTLLTPDIPDQDTIGHLTSRILVYAGTEGEYQKKLRRVVESLPGAKFVELHDLTTWSDEVAIHGQTIEQTIKPFLARHNPPGGGVINDRDGEQGEVAGITYHIRGSGPALLLLPIGLVASQWEPIIPTLSQEYCCITLGGAEIGTVFFLEARSNEAGYLGMVRTLITEAQLRPGESVLEVGSGTGILCRWLARHTGGNNPITGVDINAYLLREAAALARSEQLVGLIDFREGNAEDLPFPDDEFDVTMSATVMEEVDAGKMMAEMVRVTKPGGRVAVIVRALDMPVFINLPLPPELKAKIENQDGWAPGVAELGCADAGLYRRFHEAGLTHVMGMPQLAAFDSQAMLALLPQWLLPTLSQEEAQAWREAQAQAEAEGSYFYSWPHHCAVGTKPG